MDKLLEFQKRVQAITKDSTNPFFKSNYFDINKLLEDIKPILNELGLTINQPLSHIGEKMAIRTMLMDGDKVLFDDICPLTENSDPQKMGAAITYFRRYALQSLLALQAEDDDGNTASGNTFPRQMIQPVQPITSYIKTTGETNQVCPKCGAQMAISKSTGKPYCLAKCWLKPQVPQQNNYQNNYQDVSPDNGPAEGPIDIIQIPF